MQIQKKYYIVASAGQPLLFLAHDGGWVSDRASATQFETLEDAEAAKQQLDNHEHYTLIEVIVESKRNNGGI